MCVQCVCGSCVGLPPLSFLFFLFFPSSIVVVPPNTAHTLTKDLSAPLLSIVHSTFGMQSLPLSSLFFQVAVLVVVFPPCTDFRLHTHEVDVALLSDDDDDAPKQTHTRQGGGEASSSLFLSLSRRRAKFSSPQTWPDAKSHYARGGDSGGGGGGIQTEQGKLSSKTRPRPRGRRRRPRWRPSTSVLIDLPERERGQTLGLLIFVGDDSRDIWTNPRTDVQQCAARVCISCVMMSHLLLVFSFGSFFFFLATTTTAASSSAHQNNTVCSRLNCCFSGSVRPPPTSLAWRRCTSHSRQRTSFYHSSSVGSFVVVVVDARFSPKRRNGRRSAVREREGGEHMDRLRGFLLVPGSRGKDVIVRGRREGRKCPREDRNCPVGFFSSPQLGVFPPDL